jgi:hypothetical protein
MIKNNKRLLKLLLVLLWIIPQLIRGQELLKPPKPTHSDKGVDTFRLKLVKEITVDFDQELFFALPWDLAVNDDYIYCYDIRLIRCFIFDKQYRYVGQFLEKGIGPGEVSASRHSGRDLYAAPDGTLYFSDFEGDRLIRFSAKGKFLNDYRMYRLGKSYGIYPPVIDKDGFLYAFSTNKGIVDKIRLKPREVVHTFLDQKENGKCVIYKTALVQRYKKWKNPDGWMVPSRGSVVYDITSDGHLLVYFFRSSKVFLFRGTKLVNQFDILIDSVLPIYQKRAQLAYEKQKKHDYMRMTMRSIMFLSCFVDQDEPYFYLQFKDTNHTWCLYQFDLKGKLVAVIKNIRADIKVKRNGLFYGIAAFSRKPVIYKKE